MLFLVQTKPQSELPPLRVSGADQGLFAALICVCQLLRLIAYAVFIVKIVMIPKITVSD